MTTRKFYRTVITIEVLSEDSIPIEMELSDILDEVFEGNFSKRELSEVETKLNGKQAAKALIEQDSDPEFFQLDENGNDI